MSPIDRVIKNNETKLNPIWIMRQAGRYLPEFREIRKQNPDFIKLCLNQKLSSEITLQPLKRFDLDAAIIFSDILMLPYGLNQNVVFKKNMGPLLDELDLDKISSVEEINYFAHASKHHYEFVLGRFVGLDQEHKQVKLEARQYAKQSTETTQFELNYDTLVLAVGSTSNDFSTEGAKP